MSVTPKSGHPASATPKQRRLARRGWLWLVLAALVPIIAWRFYPTDKSPRGSYYRVVTAVNRGEPEAIFPYIETEAQHAAFSIGRYTRQAKQVVEASYPEPARTEELTRLAPLAEVLPGPGVFRWYAERYGWVARLREDLSGVQSVEVEGDRASIVTARGTRYPFRRRDTGMWGLTLFTARLVADGKKAARDFQQIEAAAADYRARTSVR